MIITIDNVEDGDLTVEMMEEGIQVQEVSRTNYDGSVIVSITYRLVEEEDAEGDEESYELGYADGMRDGSLRRGKEQQAFEFDCASVSDDSARVYGLGSQGTLPGFDAGNRRAATR